MSVEELAARYLKKMRGWMKDVRSHRVFRQKNKDTSRPETQVEQQTQESIQPWEAWELDKDFFKALSQWTLQHPDRSLDRILDSISDGLGRHKDLFQLIPDSPFPARGLVTALAHLFILGVRTAQVQREVIQFAKDVVHWVGLVKSAFETLGDGRFTREAWHYFKEMRILIDETCVWAIEQLEDGSRLRIGQKIKIQSEIQEFNRRMTGARALFQDLSSISQAKGLDAILQELQGVEHREAIIAETQKMRDAQEEERLKIAAREKFFAQTLDPRVIANPTYDAQGKRPCDEDTRTEVLDKIRMWTDDISPGTPNFLWLTGDPGCGKSTVTASLARECKDKGVLWAQLFINRNHAETTDPRSYFPSIARQLARRSNDVAEAIHDTLQQQPSLLDDISVNQASKLFIESICAASQTVPELPVVIIIDGLDETRHDRLEYTAKIFATLFTSLEAYNNVKVFISSRTENEIQKSFVLPNSKFIMPVHLDTADPTSIRDVSHYIRRSLKDIVDNHKLDWEQWPSDERSRALGDRASGLFIWGVTATKFIQEQLDSHGKECLDEVLDMLTAEVLHDINTLYMLILTITLRGNEDEWELERFRRIVGTIVVLQEPLCLDDLSALLDLRKTPSSRQADIAHFVGRFRTILVTGTDAIDGTTIPRIHKSVFEFITNKRVDSKFRVDPELAHLEIAVQCLAHVSTARELIIEDTLPVLVRYAARFWSSHLLQARTLGSRILYADFRPSPLTASPLFDSADPIHPDGSPLQIQYSAKTSNIVVAVEWPVTWSAISGTRKSHPRHYHGYDQINDIVFSPGGDEIVTCSDDKTIKICNVMNDQEVHTLVRHSLRFNSIAFSPDGKSIATGSNTAVLPGSHNVLLHLWHYSSGAPIGQPSRGHRLGVACVAFSSDGKRIASGSHDKTCILWDAWNWQAVWKTSTGHDTTVERVAFSGSSRRVCSIDRSGHCVIWDVDTGQKISEWKYAGLPECLSFSPTDDDIIAVGGWGGIEIQSHNRKWSIPHSGSTECLSFLPDGKEIIFGTWDTISVAEIGNDESTARIVRTGSFPRVEFVSSAAFSPKLDYFVYAEYQFVHVFFLQHTKTSLKVVPISTWADSKLNPKIGGPKKLKGALSNRKKAQPILGAIQTTNRRLREIRWYETGLHGGTTESGLHACVVREDVVIAGYSDGLVLVWDQRSVDKNKRQASSTQSCI